MRNKLSKLHGLDKFHEVRYNIRNLRIIAEAPLC